MQDGQIQDGRIQDGCQSSGQSESEWVLNLSESEFEDNRAVWIQGGSLWIQHGRVQDGCHHQVNQIELVWVSVRVE